jgi:hypothetical protein
MNFKTTALTNHKIVHTLENIYSGKNEKDLF